MITAIRYILALAVFVGALWVALLGVLVTAGWASPEPPARFIVGPALLCVACWGFWRVLRS